MKTNKLTRLCLITLILFATSVMLYCLSYGISWINLFTVETMLKVTVPFVAFALVCLLGLHIISSRIEEKRLMEMRRRQRQYIVREICKNRHKIIYLRKVPKLDLFRDAS